MTSIEVSRAALSPIRFLEHAAYVWRDHVAIGFQGDELSYEGLLARAERLAGGLRALGVEPGDRVATLLPNVPAMLELHFAVPGSGAVLVPMNTRLAVSEYAYILEHSGARVLIAHADLLDTADAAVSRFPDRVRVLRVGDDSEYERLASTSDRLPLLASDEDALLSINYTSGTTGKPKGVMYTHRGAYLHTLGVVATARLTSSSVYIWTLPMFHCNGWAFTWGVTAMGGRHECLRAFDPATVWQLLHEKGVTHLCAAPTVLTMLITAPEAKPLERRVEVFTGGAPPSPTLLERTERLGLDITHLYGLTETYGPIGICEWRTEWDQLSTERRAQLKARQGVSTVVSEPLRVVDLQMTDVPADGATLGEVVMRGNNVTPGYYRDPGATETAFAGGWFHSGDLAVMHPDGYIELRDRLKDIVISGGENISTIEVEQTLASHPQVLEAAVVGIPDERWGEVPRAFAVLVAEATLTVEELREFARGRLAHFKVPHEIEFVDELPKTATGKIQKFRLRQQSITRHQEG